MYGISNDANREVYSLKSKQLIKWSLVGGFFLTPPPQTKGPPLAIALSERLISLFAFQSRKKLFFSKWFHFVRKSRIKVALHVSLNQGKRSVLLAFEDVFILAILRAMSVSTFPFITPFEINLFDVQKIPLPTDDNIESIT